jgi:hypothetical protein
MNKAKLMFYMKKAIVNDEEGEVEDDEFRGKPYVSDFVAG